MYTKRPFEQSTGSCVTINELKQLYTCMLPYFLVCNSFILNLSYYNIFHKLLKMKNLNKTFKCKWFFFIYCPHVTDSVSSYLSRAYLWTFFRFTSPPLMKSRKFDGSSGFAAFKSTMALPSFISNPSFLSPSLVNWTKRMVMPYIYFQRSTCWPHHEYGASEGQYINDICMWNTLIFHCFFFWIKHVHNLKPVPHH